MSGDPYASHLPVLKMVCGLVRPRRVLELGAGKHSTPFFLTCPSLVRLISIETDPAWMPDLADPRVSVRLVDDTVEALPALDDFDLVFIDNADNATDRERAIRAVLSKEHPVTVIHDAEYPLYRKAIDDLTEDRVIFSGAPDTAVCW